jgi:hypothetical protein
MVTHDTPSDIEARSNRLKLSERAHFCGSGSKGSYQCPQAENTPSKAWAKKIPRPNRPITAVTVSNIASILPTPRTRKHRCDPAQSKGFREGVAHSRSGGDFQQQVSQKGPARLRLTLRANGLRRQPLIYHDRRLPISALFRLRYRPQLVRGVVHRGGSEPVAACVQAANRLNGNWGRWGFDTQIAWSG